MERAEGTRGLSHGSRGEISRVTELSRFYNRAADLPMSSLRSVRPSRAVFRHTIEP